MCILKKSNVCALLFALLMLTCTAISEDNKYFVETDDFVYSVMQDGNLEVSWYQGSDAEVYIPANVEDRKVTTIASHAFGFDDHVEIIHISEGISHIREFAFYGSTIEYVLVPESVKVIEKNAVSNLSPRLIFVEEGSNKELYDYCSENNVELMNDEDYYHLSDRIVSSLQFDKLFFYASADIGMAPESLDLINSEDVLENTRKLSFSIDDYGTLALMCRKPTGDIISMTATYQWDGNSNHLASYLVFINKLLFVSGIINNASDEMEYINRIGLIENLTHVCDNTFNEDHLIVSYSIDQDTKIDFSIQCEEV